MYRFALSAALAGLMAFSGFAQEAPPEGENGDRGPRAQVARFLQLSETQAEAWQAILADQRDQTQPLLEQIRSAEQALKELLAAEDASADAVGSLVIEIKGLRSDIGTIHRAAVDAFEALLETEQADRLSFVRAAARVQPVIPAFREAGLIGGQGGASNDGPPN